MRTFLLRLLRLVAVVLAVTIITFLLLDQTEGDPALWKLGFNADPELVEQERERLGLNRSAIARYGDWLGDAVQGDFGESIVLEGISSRSRLADALPATIQLIIMAEIIAFAVAVPLAIWSAQRPNSVLDRLSSGSAFALLALPAFVLGVYLKYVFGVWLGWFPTIINDPPSIIDDPWGNLRQFLLPGVVLGLNLVAVYLRLLRSDMIATMQEDYVMLARARGLSPRRILWRHALRPSSLNLVTAAGLNVAALIGGSIVVEQVFAINGMGRLIIGSILGKDYELALTAVTLLTIGYVVLNYAVDGLYRFLDPRIRHAS